MIASRGQRVLIYGAKKRCTKWMWRSDLSANRQATNLVITALVVGFCWFRLVPLLRFPFCWRDASFFVLCCKMHCSSKQFVHPTKEAIRWQKRTGSTSSSWEPVLLGSLNLTTSHFPSPAYLLACSLVCSMLADIYVAVGLLTASKSVGISRSNNADKLQFKLTSPC